MVILSVIGAEAVLKLTSALRLSPICRSGARQIIHLTRTNPAIADTAGVTTAADRLTVILYMTYAHFVSQIRCVSKNRTPACDQYGITAPVHNIHKLFQQRETLFNFRLTTTKKFRHLSASRPVCSKYQADLMRLTLLVSSTLARDEISHYLLSAQTSWSLANILTISDRQLQVTKQCCRTKTD